MQSHPDEEQDDEAYNSASDEDFDPDTAAADAEAASSDEEDKEGTANGRKRRRAPGEAEDLDFDNSGDEATVRKGQRKKKKRKSGAAGDDEDEGGDGGLIKTRSQRMQETKEKKPLVQAGKATVNVDDLWAQMSTPAPTASPIPPAPSPTSTTTAQPNTTTSTTSTSTPNAPPHPPTHPSPASAPPTDTITIKRTYEFAGQLSTEERIVPASSAEAKLYLAEQEAATAAAAAAASKPTAATAASKPGTRKPMKRKSMFATAGATAGTGYGSAAAAPQQGPKLTTLQKSRLDWAQQVDREGIAAELDEHARAKDSYAGRMDFLGRMEAKREEDVRASRAK